MPNKFLADAEIERRADRLLGRYEVRYGPISGPPIPVERILEDVLDLSILWDTILEEPGQSILAGLDPNNRTVVFNESRLALIEERHRVCTTRCWATKRGIGKPTWIRRFWTRPRCRTLTGSSVACFGSPVPVRIPGKGRLTSSWAICSCPPLC